MEMFAHYVARLNFRFVNVFPGEERTGAGAAASQNFSLSLSAF